MIDIRGNEVREGDRVVYATKTEAPSLQFGRIVEIDEQVEVKQYAGREPGKWVTVRIKIQQTDASGNDLNKTTFKLNPATNRYEYMDTGRKQTSWIQDSGSFHKQPWPDHITSHRLMVL
jgi:hypothetical protein